MGRVGGVGFESLETIGVEIGEVETVERTVGYGTFAIERVDIVGFERVDIVGFERVGLARVRLAT